MNDWSLLRIIYNTLVDRTGETPSTDICCCLVPGTWREFAPDRLAEQVKSVMNLACAQYNRGINATEDPAHILYFDWTFEWVSEPVVATKPWTSADLMLYVDVAGEVHLEKDLYTVQPQLLTYRRNPWGFFEERLL